MEIAQSKDETALYLACTTIEIGNGARTHFWHDQWLQGQSPQDLAPALYRLAWHKNITVAQGCTKRKWLNGLR
jgi:hypothetical protein